VELQILSLWLNPIYLMSLYDPLLLFQVLKNVAF